MHGIVGTQSLGTDILDADRLHHRTNRAAGDNAGTGCGRLHQDAACAVLADDLMRNGSAAQRNLDQVLLGVLDALADSVRNFAGLTDAEADGAVAVADDDQSGKLEDTAALYGLRYTVDGNYTLLQFQCAGASNLAKSIPPS